MVELSPISWTDLVRRLRQLGFDGPFQGGKHPYMIKGSLVLTIPNPHRRQIGVPLPYFEARRGQQRGMVRKIA